MTAVLGGYRSQPLVLCRRELIWCGVVVVVVVVVGLVFGSSSGNLQEAQGSWPSGDRRNSGMFPTLDRPPGLIPNLAVNQHKVLTYEMQDIGRQQSHRQSHSHQGLKKLIEASK